MVKQNFCLDYQRNTTDASVVRCTVCTRTFVFYADEDNVPYGTKTKEQVMEYVRTAFDFLMTQDVKAIVTACNTATSVAVSEMRRRYSVPIIGMEPAAKKAPVKKAAAKKAADRK